MTSTSKPTVSLSKVPSVKELCELLGFQHASLKDTNTFMELTRAWRKSYQTSSGRSATELLHWNQSSDQLDLEEMAQKFVDNKGNGDRFWSPSRSWNHDSDLKFPEDRARIVALLKQLFWKQNRYAYNNSQYAHKGPEPRDQSREKTTPVRQIHTEMHDAAPTPVAPTADPDPVQMKGRSPRNPSALKETSHKPPPTGNSMTGGSNTPFPDTIEIVDDSSSYDGTTVSRSPKRPRPSTGESPRKKKKSRSAAPLRRTDRKRTIRNLPDAVPDDQVELLINDRIDRTRNIQPPRVSITEESRFKALDAETFAKSPSTQVPPVVTQHAPTAPMVASGIRKSSSPQAKASKVAQATNLSDLKKSSTPSSPRNNSSIVVRKRRIEPILELEKSDLRTSCASSPTAISDSGPSAQENENYAFLRFAGPIDETSEADDSRPVQRASSAPSNAEHNTSDLHKSSTHEEDNGKTAPTAELLPSNRELPPAPSGHYVESTANPAPVLEQMQTPSKSSDIFKSLPDALESVTENPSKTELPLLSAETVNNEMKISTTGRTLQQAPSKMQPAQRSPPQASSPKPRQKTQIPLWIITREPRYTEERWDEGRFMGTPLPAFIEGLSKFTQRSHIEKVKLTLRAPTFDTKITVFNDAEDSWASAKETFIEKLKEARVEARAKRQIEHGTFKILVEPFYEESALPSGSLDDYEDEFEF